MTTTASSRPNPPPSRQSLRATSISPSSNGSIARGATARSALTNPRVPSTINSAAARRSSVKGQGATHPSDARPQKDEAEEREKLLVQLQNKDQTITSLTENNHKLSSALHEADSRLNEFYADQSRMEDEMAARIEVSEKLRAQVRELEKEKRDVQRRYNEQTTTFEAERQAFYDNEQHLKSRIQSLSQARRQSLGTTQPPESDAEHESEGEDITDNPPSGSESPYRQSQDINDAESEPAEMTALKLELSTLSTSYSSLHSTLILLQTQLVDLKRVNNELQEENESYMILLREKTLSGTFDLMKQVGVPTSTTDDDEDMDIYGGDGSSGEVGSMKSSGRSTLDRVDEMSEHEHDEFDHDDGDNDDDIEPSEIEATPAVSRRHKRSESQSSTHAPRGESLAGLPITGPGLDLAAELGRAENKDIIGGTSIDDTGLFPYGKRRGKKGVESRKVSTASEGFEASASTNDLDALRNEVRSLKDANKALSLYASKIIDRIIAEEGFEHVLSVDYEKSPITPPTAVPRSYFPKAESGAADSKARRHSTIFTRSTSGLGSTDTSPNPMSPSTTSTDKTQRRSLSFDWKSFSMFGDKKPDANPSLRPLTLKPGNVPVTGARKLETHEDDEDRIERERLKATMKLMGLEPPTETPVLIRSLSNPAPPMQKSFSSPQTMTSPPPPPASNRFSFFRSRSTQSETSSMDSAQSAPNAHFSSYGGLRIGVEMEGGGLAPSELTQEALGQIEAVNAIATLEQREKVLSDEIAKGGRSGFTELSPRPSLEDRRSRRSKRSVAGSGSTVWSAGMSRAGDEPESLA